MKARLITAGIGIVFCVGVFFLCEQFALTAAIALAIVDILLVGEFLTARKLHKNFCILIPSVLFAGVMPFAVLVPSKLLNGLIPDEKYFPFFLIPLFLYATVIFFFTVIFHQERIHTDDVMLAFAGATLISLSVSSIAYTACTNGFVTFWLVAILGIPWLADSVAYFVGSAIGKHQLAPIISPKKSIEGAVGGLIGGTLGGMLIGFIFTLIYPGAAVNYLVLGVLGFVNSVVSILGDLTFSVIKRHCDIKDYGSILPGHGGLLDRFDSVIFCAPIVFFVSRYVEIIWK